MIARYVLDKLAIEAAHAQAEQTAGLNWHKCPECRCNYVPDDAAMVLRCPLCAAIAPEEGE